MNHETQLDLRLAGSKEFSLLLKLILYTSFEVITGFLCPFNRRIRFKSQFHAIVSLVDKTFQTANEQGRAEQKLLHVKMSSGATYAVRSAVRRTPYAVRRTPQSRAQSFSGSLSAVGRRDKLWDNGFQFPI